MIISVNPNSGASDKQFIARELGEMLQERGFQVHIPTSIPDLREKAVELQNAGRLHTVVAAGGDGTAAMLVNELPFQFTMAILPLGTENLLAKYLHLSADPELLANLIEEQKSTMMDVGKANGKFFLVMCSCGFDADVVSRLHSERKGHISHWSYARPIVNAIQRYRYPALSISFRDESDEVVKIKSKWAFIFNVPRYAMNLPIVTDADTSDGFLDLCTFKGGNLLRGLFYLTGVLLKQHRRWKDTRFAKVRKLTIESDEEVPFQIDGDPGGVLPLELEAVPNYLRVIVGPTWVSQNVRESDHTSTAVEG